jgi:hypothetical protein
MKQCVSDYMTLSGELTRVRRGILVGELVSIREWVPTPDPAVQILIPLLKSLSELKLDVRRGLSSLSCLTAHHEVP